MNRQSRGLDKRCRRVGYAGEHLPCGHMTAESAMQKLGSQHAQRETVNMSGTAKEPAEPANHLVGDSVTVSGFCDTASHSSARYRVVSDTGQRCYQFVGGRHTNVTVQHAFRRATLTEQHTHSGHQVRCPAVQNLRNVQSMFHLGGQYFHSDLRIEQRIGHC